MQHPQINLMYNIIGIGAASGLIFDDGRLFILSDNSSYLYSFEPESFQLEKIRLSEVSSEHIAKQEKPDFEAIAAFNGSLYLFGSGSSPKRTTLLEVDIKTKQVVQTLDLTVLYTALQAAAGITQDDFNIEGVIYDGINWLLLNRGNVASNKNIIFIVDGIKPSINYHIQCFKYDLPLLKGVRASFTDGVLVDDKIYFVATAEDTVSTYDDGAVLGSLIGQIDRMSMKMEYTEKISDSAKLEGLALFSASGHSLEFLLCEDNDSGVQESNIYKVSIEKRHF